MARMKRVHAGGVRSRLAERFSFHGSRVANKATIHPIRVISATDPEFQEMRIARCLHRDKEIYYSFLLHINFSHICYAPNGAGIDRQ